MLKRLDFYGYQVIPADGDAGVSTTFDLDVEGVDVELEVRAQEGAYVFVVNEDGEKIFVDAGSIISLKARLIGAAQLVVESDGDLALRSRAVRSLFGEKVDPVPAAVSVRRPSVNPIDYEVRRAVDARLRAMGLAPEIIGAVNEELEDAGGLDGDFELEDDPDPFGPGHYEEVGGAGDPPPPEPSTEPAGVVKASKAPKAAKPAEPPPEPPTEPAEGNESGEA